MVFARDLFKYSTPLCHQRKYSGKQGSCSSTTLIPQGKHSPADFKDLLKKKISERGKSKKTGKGSNNKINAEFVKLINHLRNLTDKAILFRPMVVGPNEIAGVAAVWSGIPDQKLTADERMLLVGLDELLKKWVVGQDEAISAICRAIRRSTVGFKDPKRPIATMVFCGHTGVGKTKLKI